MTIQAAPVVDSKQTAANIVKGVQDKASGKTPEVKEPVKSAEPVIDPNAGKKRFVVEGKEVWLTSDQADAYVQKGIAFEPKVSELARMRQEMIQFEKALLENPGTIIANLSKRANVPIQDLVKRVLSGTSSDEVKEATGKWYWENVAQRQKMDPKDLAILERDEKIKKYEEDQKNKELSILAAENKARVDAAFVQVRAQISEAMKEIKIVKDLDSPLGIVIAKRVADIMRLSYLQKQPCTPKQAAEKAQEEILNIHKMSLDDSDEEGIINKIGKENAEKVRKYFLKLVKQSDKEVKGNAEPKPRKGERETITPDDFHDYLDDLKRNGK